MTVSVAKHNNNHHHLLSHMMSLQFHHQNHSEDLKGVPKGCMAVIVGTQAEEQEKFVIPVVYINHPLFMQLLKEAEEEFGFRHDGPITIPCHVEQFRAVQCRIDKENSDHHNHHHDHHHHHHNNHHHHGHVWCFRVLFPHH